MTFRSTNIRHIGGSEFAVTGHLTIKDVTKPVEFVVTFEGVGINPWGAEVAGVSARAQVDREDWGLTWNAALETGGVLVGKKVSLAIEIQGARA
jgi:polyisoprenoid-binding protein YceI